MRKRLHELADDLDFPELHELAEELRRRRNGRRSPVVSATVTEDLAAAVRAFAAAYPDMPLAAVARVFKLNQGRVSEVLYGKRE